MRKQILGRKLIFVATTYSLKYTADEARSLKAYGELPETAKINETDTFGGGEDGDCAFEFDEDRDSESGEEGGAGGKEIEIDDI